MHATSEDTLSNTHFSWSHADRGLFPAYNNHTQPVLNAGLRHHLARIAMRRKPQDPVNNDGTTWHTQHAQIDACVSCHAGNPQSTDKTQSHTGMVPWYSDVKAGVLSCHPDDYTTACPGICHHIGGYPW